MSGTVKSTPQIWKGTWLSRLAWVALVYNVLVILWGAVVRITGAGAGCGDHWPLCNGVVVPQSPEVHTIIELSHRLTAGLSGVLAIVLVFLAFRQTSVGHPVRLGAVLSLAFVLLEGLVGGIQVLLGLTADSTDPARGFVQGIHLANTFALLGALLLTALWASGRPIVRVHGQGMPWLLGLVGLVSLLLLGMAGAVTALGDLLFVPPDGSTPIETVKRDFGMTATIIENMRVVHPLFAIVVSAFLAWYAFYLREKRPSSEVSRWSLWLWGLLGVQTLAGFANILLKAPAWMQLTHLLLACLMWLVVVMLLYSALTTLRVSLPSVRAAETSAAGSSP